MSKLIVNGGARLDGALTIHGAKNSVLPILSATYLTHGESVLHNCPNLTDVRIACDILRKLGCEVQQSSGSVVLRTAGANGTVIPAEYMREMRSSIVFLGAMLGKTGQAVLCAPGGCNLGPRPIDLHLAALRRMGVQIREENDTLCCSAPNGLTGSKICFPLASVGATENVLIAACTARGCTQIRNAAREPEIVDLARYLQRCGARIYGAGTPIVEVEGVSRLHGAEYEVMPDRIETATYLTAAAVTGGEILLRKTEAAHLQPVIARLKEAGCHVRSAEQQIHLRAPQRLYAFSSVETAPYPAFPTDAQAICMAAALQACGKTAFCETVFSDRFRHVAAFQKMGAEIMVCGNRAVVHGVKKLHGTAVCATDLRGGAAMVLAGLSAEGTTEITNVQYIDRGYEQMEDALAQLGAHIRRECVWQRQEKQKTTCPAAG